MSSWMVIDIETELHSNRIWMIGIKVDNLVVQFVAQQEEDFPFILNKFSQFLTQSPRRPLVMFSGNYFDVNTLINSTKEWNTLGNSIDLEKQLKGRTIVDLCLDLQQVYRAPQGLALKTLGKTLNYTSPFMHSPLERFHNGYAIAKEYVRRKNQGLLNSHFMESSLNYNTDDLLLVEFVAKQLHSYFNFNSQLFSPLDKREGLKWIRRNSRLICSTEQSLEVYFSKKQVFAAIRIILGMGGTIPRLTEDNSQIIFRWTGLGKRLMEGYLVRKRGVLLEEWYAPCQGKTIMPSLL